MKKSRVLAVVVVVFGLILIVWGTLLWGAVKEGPVSTQWIIPVTVLPHSILPTWGVSGGPTTKPDKWSFQVFFVGNDTAQILLIWNLNQILYNRTANKTGSASIVEDSFEVQLPPADHQWRWDWAIMNPNDSRLALTNFTVIHHSISYPTRPMGLLLVGFGFVMTVAASAFCLPRPRSSSGSSTEPSHGISESGALLLHGLSQQLSFRRPE